MKRLSKIKGLKVNMYNRTKFVFSVFIDLGVPWKIKVNDGWWYKRKQGEKFFWIGLDFFSNLRNFRYTNHCSSDSIKHEHIEVPCPPKLTPPNFISL